MHYDSLKTYPLRLILPGVIALASALIIFEPSHGEGGWQTPLSDSSRSAFAKDAVSLPPKASWSSGGVSFIERKAPIDGSPVIFNDMALYTDTTSTLHALDTKTKKSLWSFEADAPIEASPSVADEVVYAATIDGTLFALDLISGETLWSVETGASVTTAPLITGVTVYVFTSENRLYAFEAADGKKLWSYSRPLFDKVRLANTGVAASAEGRIYHVFSDGYLVCLDATTGDELWAERLHSGSLLSAVRRKTPQVVPTQGRVYAVDETGAVVAFDYASGSELMRYEATRAVDFVVRGRLMVVASPGAILGISVDSSKVLWRELLEESASTVSVITAGKEAFLLYNNKTAPFSIEKLASKKGFIEAYSLSGGSSLWREKIPGEVLGRAASDKGRIALITAKGELYFFGP